MSSGVACDAERFRPRRLASVPLVDTPNRTDHQPVYREPSQAQRLLSAVFQGVAAFVLALTAIGILIRVFLPDLADPGPGVPEDPAVTFVVFSLAALAAIARAAHVYRRRYRWMLLCTACGYDMQGSPTNRCPECSHEAPPLWRRKAMRET